LRPSDVGIRQDSNHDGLLASNSSNQRRGLLQQDRNLIKPTRLVEVGQPFERLVVIEGNAEEAAEGLSD
jgi:hypothetical protein